MHLPIIYESFKDVPNDRIAFVVKGLEGQTVGVIGAGHKSRQIFDQVWLKFSGLGQISRTNTDDTLKFPMCEFIVPGAQNTTVLVVGATSRIGRVVIRKRMLRGYNVKPQYFDTRIINELGSSKKSRGGSGRHASKVSRHCNWGCRRTLSSQVCNRRLQQDHLLRQVCEGTYFQDVVAAKYDGGMDSKFEFTETGNVVFSGEEFEMIPSLSSEALISAKEEPDASILPVIDGLLRVHKHTVDSLDADLSNAPTPLSFLKGEGTTLPKLAIPSRTPIQIREILNGGITLAGVIEPEVRSKEEMATYFSRESLTHATGSTNMNRHSRCVLHPY
ncbi:hypothetical protein GIB67_006548 [Kingdonia uniflora]|uniref:Uncharacterized protein n=1 Tax=Kingdonia uniflora TaxID=39325 RepID=A0A7J7LEP6_9MAGN|nr:hypothetical protein GIB67_006548 [Kingdonia uniflora]